MKGRLISQLSYPTLITRSTYPRMKVPTDWSTERGTTSMSTKAIIIEPRSLVREALEALMAAHSYRVVGGVGSVSAIGESATRASGAALVLLSGMCASQAVAEAAAVRELWPESHIVFLFESASIDDSLQVMMSEIDGCVPLSASPDTLVSTLRLVLSTDVRVIVVTDNGHGPAAFAQASAASIAAPDEGSSPVIDHTSVSTASPNTHPDSDRYGSEPRRSATCPTLSEREAQILDGLVKGHANKVIARTCDITEATVKVHMKSILRKIRVANRTQAAIWALENGYSCGKAKVGMSEQQTPPALL